MGEIADMMLEGLLDEETGECIGDTNKEKYGIESQGFPVSYERESRAHLARRVHCPRCDKRVKATGLLMHIRDVHGADNG